jgi:hypothetical protein
MPDLRKLTDEKLVDLLFTEGDALDRSVANEVLRRGGLVDRLSRIVADPYNWNEPVPASWAVVHAVYLLGSIGTTETVLPLLRSLRYGEACENDWITGDLPSIFGSIGPPAVEGLRAIARDRTSGWLARSVAMEGLAAVTLDHPELSPDLFPFIHGIFADTSEERAVRQAAGHILIDHLRAEYREELSAFGKEERSLADRSANGKSAFTDRDVDDEFRRGEKAIERYTRDWMVFYEADEVAERGRRRDEERRERAEEPEHATHHELCPFATDHKKKKCCLGKVGLA